MNRTRQILKSATCLAVGLALVRGAQAAATLVGDTTVTFDNAGFNNGDPIPTSYGSNATGSTPAGVVVGGSGQGLGTPDISLNWVRQFNGFGQQPTQFEYAQIGGVNGGLLNNSLAGQTHELDFNVTPTSSVVLTSLDFQSVGANGNSYNYLITVRDAGTSDMIGSAIPVTVTGDGNKTAPVSLGISGNIGESLKLQITRTGGTGDGFSMVVDDIAFSEVVPEPGSLALLGLGLGGMGLMTIRRWRK